MVSFDQVCDEFRTGRHMKLRKAENLQVKAAAATGRRRFFGDQGEVAFQIRPEFFHYWGQRLGYEAWKDPQFVKEFLRDNPQCRVDSRSEKIQSGHGGNSRATGRGRLPSQAKTYLYDHAGRKVRELIHRDPGSE